MQDNSEQIEKLNNQLQNLKKQCQAKVGEMKSTLDFGLTPRPIPSKNITCDEAELEEQKSHLVELNANLSGLEEKFSQAKEVYECANTSAKKHINIWMEEYMPHLLNQEFFIDAFIRENKNFQYTPVAQRSVCGDDMPGIDPACAYVEKYNSSADATIYGQVNRAADPIFHLNEQKALKSIRSSISRCQSESDVVELFKKFLVYGSKNQEHKNAVEAMANYFFSNKSRVANQDDTDMNARLGHFLHYIQANDAGQYNFSEKIPGDGWFTSDYKTCFENLFHSRQILIANKWDEFGRLKALCEAVSDQKPAMDSAQLDVNVGQAKVLEKQQAINLLQKELERKNKYSKLYKEWETIKDKIDKLNNQISNLSNDPRESKHAPIAPPSDADRGKITKPKLTPAWASAQPPEKNNTPRNLCDRLKKHYLHIKNEEKDFLMTKESINARISAADNELKDMDFSRVSESDFVNHHAKFGLGGIFTMKRFSYLLKMRYRHERFLKNNENNENNEVKIYEKLMENFSSNFESSPRGLFDGLDLEGVEKSMEGVLNKYFQDLKDFSLFSGNEGYRKSKDFSKALHIQDRLQLLSQYLAKMPTERMEFCSSFQNQAVCEMRGERKGRFLTILTSSHLRTLVQGKLEYPGIINLIIEHLEGLPVSSGVEVYKAVQNILQGNNYKLDLGIGFFEFSHRSHEKDLEAQLKALAEKVQADISAAEVGHMLPGAVTPPRKLGR